MVETVLIVDDIDANLYLLRTILKHNGYKIIEAKNGQEALEMALKVPPDLIISDILMPVMDGFSLCKAWREDEHLQVIPFIFYTATYTEQKDADFGLSLGADRFLIKPLEGHEIIKEVVNALANTASSPKAHQNAESLSIVNDDFYRVYNSRLIHKLESKLVELEEKNCELLEKEKEVRKLNDNLENRIQSRTRELSLLNDDLEAFNYSVSHDLRAPLRHIIGFSDMLIEDYGASLDKNVLENITRIQASGQKMEVIIRSLLRLSKLKTSGLKRSSVNLSVMVERIVTSFTNASGRDVGLSIQEGVYADCDTEMLQIVLDNLLQNAWKFTSKKSHALVEFGCQVNDGQTVFFVRDNGAGFNAEYGYNLFKPFQRLHSQSEFEGIGVGLATAKRIVNYHEGELWAEGKINEGACFYFTLNNKIDNDLLVKPRSFS